MKFVTSKHDLRLTLATNISMSYATIEMTKFAIKIKICDVKT